MPIAKPDYEVLAAIVLNRMKQLGINESFDSQRKIIEAELERMFVLGQNEKVAECP